MGYGSSGRTFTTMTTKLSPQKEKIVSVLRDLKWHCGREWLHVIKDDRKRISELNENYMAVKGYEIIGEPCKGEVCGRKECPLFKRKAVPRTRITHPAQIPCESCIAAQAALKAFNNTL